MKTTQYATAKYTEMYDISTNVGKNVFYKIHTPTGVGHMRQLAGFFKQFKEYKYSGARIAWVPITTLPKDPLGVGYEAGDQADPRDLINPILHKGYKGEPLKTDYMTEQRLETENTDILTHSESISKIEQPTTADATYMKNMYYTSLTHQEWGKAHPREGFYQELYPLVRTLASTKQINPVSGQDDWEPAPEFDMEGNPPIPKDGDITAKIGTQNESGTIKKSNIYAGVNQTDVFTHEFERLGWMETSAQGTVPSQSMYDAANMTDLNLNRMPKVYMYLVQTPPAYKQRQYYRMSVTHEFEFRKFREVYGLDGPNVWSDMEFSRPATPQAQQRKIPGARMYDTTGKLWDGDYTIQPYEPALENSIETEGEATITKISEGVS